MLGHFPSPCSMQIKLFLIPTLLTVLNLFQLQQLAMGPVGGKEGAQMATQMLSVSEYAQQGPS